MSGSAQINTSLYPQAAPAQTIANPLDQMAKLVNAGQGIANIRQQSNANLEFQQQQAYQAQVGQVMKQSLGPDGQVDPGKFALGVSTNPATSRYAPQLIQNMISNGQVQAQTVSTTLQNQAKKFDNINTLLSPLVSQGDSVKQGDVVKQLALGQGMGMFTPEEVAPVMKTLASDQPTTDPTTGKSVNPLAKQLSQIALSTANSREALKSVRGVMGLTDTGPAIVPTSTGGITGMAPPGQQQAALATGLTPQQNNELVNVKHDDGSTTAVPRWLAAPTVDASGKVLNPQSPAQVMVGNNPTTDQVNTVYAPDLAQRVIQAPIQMKAIERQADLLQYLTPDMSEPMRVNFAAALKATHNVSPDQYNSILGGNPQAIAAAQELVKQQFMGATAQFISTVGKGAASQQQLDAYQRILPNLATDKVATSNMLDYFHQLAQQPLKEQQVFDLYKKSGRPMEKYPDFLAQSMMRAGTARMLNPGELSNWAQSQPSTAAIPPGGVGGVAHAPVVGTPSNAQ